MTRNDDGKDDKAGNAKDDQDDKVDKAENGPYQVPVRKRRIPHREIIAIFMLLVGLFCVLALRKPCAQGVARMVDGFDPVDAGPRTAPLRKPGP